MTFRCRGEDEIGCYADIQWNKAGWMLSVLSPVVKFNVCFVVLLFLGWSHSV